MVARILLTGGRAPATLELARMFAAAGHVVFMAESLRCHLTRPSRAIARNYQVPPPNRAPDAYIQALCAILCREKSDLLLPTCEELFWVARGRAQLSAHCAIFAEGIEHLRQLHDKGAFAALARTYGLTVPKTVVLTTPQELHALAARNWDGMAEVVLKPAYSRFATKTLMPTPLRGGRVPTNAGVTQAAFTQALRQIRPTSPWVAQQFVRGRQFCTYSVAHAGQLAAHTTYAVDFRAGSASDGSPAIVFQHLDHGAILAWVHRFVEQNQFSGQIAFDFIEPAVNACEGGEPGLFAIECNPRTTSGVHLFAGTPGFAETFLGLPPGPWLTPSVQRPSMLMLAMLFYALPAVRSWPELRRWLATLCTSREVIFTAHDPLPGLWQGIAVAELLARAWRCGLSAVEASTDDIEWNGE